ncbi:MAG: amino-acid N-acetyltransferase [Verrucomicrobia bacterium]|nr:MAG: amino-acid N-acetyltransferase [Verrucomicrobiota bacterium]
MSSSSSNPVSTIKPTDLRGILNYVPRFQGQTFVIAMDGSIVADENLSNLLLDIAVLKSLHIRVVLVHGVGHQLKELSAIRKVAISDAEGTGLTDPDTLDLAIRASSRVSHQILEGLTQAGLKCSITNAVRSVPVGIVKGVDQQFSGKVTRIDQDFVAHLIDADVIPIIQPIGFSRDGQTLRINSDLMAVEMATALKATKVIYLSPHTGLEIDGGLRRDIPAEELDAIVRKQPGRINPKLRSKATHAVTAIGSGVPRVHLIDGRVHDSLLNELFSNEGVGTLIFGNDYRQIRQATRRDVRLIHNLIRNAVRRDELIFRTQQAIERNIGNFYVFEIDGNLFACVSLTYFPDQPDMAEVGSLHVVPFYNGRGAGQKMVEFACREARIHGAKKIIALSTQSFTFFSEICDFKETDHDSLPESRQASYDKMKRNPRILIKEL